MVLVTGGCGGPAAVPAAHPEGRVAAACAALAARLPDRVADQPRRGVTPTSDGYTAAWGAPPITLRCGVARPGAYTRTSQLFVFNHVDWLPVPQDVVVPTRFYAVGRRAYVEVVVPKEHEPFSDALVDLTAAVQADPQDPAARP